MFKYQVIVFGNNNDSKSAVKSKSNNENLALQIKEACDKAELQVKQPKPVKKAAAPVERPASAASTKPSAGSTAPKAVKRPTSAAPKKPAVGGAKKPASSSSMNFSSCFKA